jgi:hypothetical protein
MLRIVALTLAVLTLNNCGQSVVSPPKSVDTRYKCPNIPVDLAKEAKRGPSITKNQQDPFDITLTLLGDLKRKNDSLKRALKIYQRCRET